MSPLQEAPAVAGLATETEVRSAVRAPAAGQPPECVIIHNHWIHYKDLLFRAMHEIDPSFLVLFTAASSDVRLPAHALAGAPYTYKVSFPGDYERVSQLGAAIRTYRTLERLQPRVLVVSGWYDGAGWAAWLWGNMHRVPMVLWAESNAFDHPRHRPLESVKKFYVKWFQVVHVYGTSNREYLLQLGMASHRIVTKRAVLDVRSFTRRPEIQKDPGHTTLLYVGRFSEEKNLESLLMALGRLRGERLPKPLKLTLVGYGPLEARLRLLTETLGLADAVVFAGAAPQNRLPIVYSAADVFVLPSTREPWGLVANEAMCCELPVAVSNRCGCASDLVNPDTGWVFDPFNLDDIVRVLRRISEMPSEQLAVMGKRAREVSARYSPENCARLVCASLSDAISKRFSKRLRQ
jgi:glycosyltransferase involved in cell wall biosynthesis